MRELDDEDREALQYLAEAARARVIKLTLKLFIGTSYNNISSKNRKGLNKAVDRARKQIDKAFLYNAYPSSLYSTYLGVLDQELINEMGKIIKNRGSMERN
jgi:hypothetical protein